MEGEIELTYPRFAKACYAFFAVAVLAAVLKLSVSGAEPALLKMLPSAPTATAVEPMKASPEGPEDPRLGSFSDDEAEKREAVFSRASSRSDASRIARRDGPERADEGPDGSSGDASVFRRPSRDPASSEPVCGDLGDAPRSSRAVFPLPQEYFDSYDDTWGAARLQGGHEGSDLMSPAGTPEFALTDGKLVGVAGSNENGWNRLGGYAVMLEAAYDIGPIKKGDLFYYAHLDREGSLPVGTTVRAGQKIGTAGDTGEGPEVTRGKFPPHLHLGWYDANLSEERSEAESGAMNPYPLLLWLERNGGAVSGGTDASYCQAPQGPTPSTGGPDWPTPSSPGERPDLDTGDGDASPVARAEHRQDRPKRDRGDRDRGGEKENGQETVANEPDETVQAEQPQREADEPEEAEQHQNGAKEPEEVEEPKDEAKGPKKSSFRRKFKVKLDALLRDLPSGTFERSVPEGRNDSGRNDEGEGRKGDGRDGQVRGEEPPTSGRPQKDRPGGRHDAPPDDAPKAPVAVPDRQPRPVPDEPGGQEAEAAKDKPRAETPPNTVPKRPTTEPAPAPDAGETATGGVAPTLKEAAPAPGRIVDAPEGDAVEVPETDGGE